MNATSSSVQLGAMDLYHALPCPEGWTTRRLRFVTRINKAQPILLAPEDEVSFVPMAAVGEHGGIRLDQVKVLDEIGDGYTYFADGDVVVAKITPCFENGKGAFAQGLKNGIAFGTTELHVIRPADDVDGRFLFYLSISELFRRLGEGAMYGAGGQKRVPELFIKDFQALLPPMDQQQKIAAFLDRKTAEIDALIAKKRRLLDLLAEKRTALITRAVTKGLNPDAPMKDSGIEWLGEIPAHWKVVRLRYVTQRIEQGWSPQCENRQASIGEWGVLKVGCVNGETYDETENKALPVDLPPKDQYEVREGDILVSRANTKELLGSAALVNKTQGKILLCDKLYRLETSSSVHKGFLVRVLRSRAARFQYERDATGTSGSMQNIGQDTLKDLTFACPPFEEQRKIEARLITEMEQFGQLQDRIDSAVTRLEEYRSALITNAVTGQIKVA
ncbi:MAG: restriction endonuclease subunit S [Methylothermaceae bacterium]|nr:restriction endonuclease subunit S [Methylothermaceae bacterium]